MGYIGFDEPFLSLVHQGVILGPDGTRMSKTKGNIINPDKYIEAYGSDILRLYLMFGFSYMEGGPWSEDGLKSIARFVERMERAVMKALDYTECRILPDSEKELDYALNYAIKNISADLDAFSFNTAVARLMELVNAMYKADGNVSATQYKAVAVTLIKLIAPMTPHIAEELYHIFGFEGYVSDAEYPVCDESYLIEQSFEYPVMINGKLRFKQEYALTASPDEITADIVARPAAQKWLDVKAPKKVIVVKGKIINIVL